MFYYYTLFPLEKFLFVLLFVLHGFTGSYLLSLILLSIVVRLITSPLEKLASKSVKKEHEISSVLAPQIRQIKEKFKGRERHEAIKRLYARYSYHPIYAVRSMSGLLVQLPFFIAAFYMIGESTALQGSIVPFIGDLGQQDKLLFDSINLLPFIMTGVNLLALYTTPNFNKKESIQGLIIALIFLILLYSSPAALLIYWTVNNLISLSKNIFFLKFNHEKGTAPFGLIFKHVENKKPMFFLNSGLPDNRQRLLTAACLFYILFTIFIGTPLSLFINSPRDFFIPFSNILFPLLIAFGMLSAAAIAVIWLIPEKLQTWFCFMSVYAAVVVFLYTNLIVPDYGQLDNFKFIIFDNLGRTFSQKLIEYSALLALLILCYRFYHKLSKYLLVGVILVSLLSIIISVIHINKGILYDEKYVPQSNESTPAHSLAFSPDKKNVLILLLDGFSGSLIPELIQEGFLDGFNDFTWYRNTLATNGGTWGSIAAVVGGHKYTVEQVNIRPKVHIAQMLNEAYSVLPSAFNSRGYDITVINPMFRAMPQGNPLIIYPEQEAEQLILRGLQKDKKKKYIMHKQILMLSIFKAAPMALKNYIYYGGSWHIYKHLYEDHKKNDETPPHVLSRKLTHWNLLNNLSTLPIRIQDSPTFTFAHIMVPHYPWIIDSELNISNKNGTYKDEARYAMLILSKLFHNMRRHRVFDNTMITVISDHGMWMDSDLFEKNFNDKIGHSYENRASPGMLHALLLVKEAGETNKTLLISDKFLSNADLPSIVCTVIGGCKDVMGDARTITGERQQTYSIFRPYSSDKWLDSTNGFPKKFIKEQFIVKESIFEAANWARIK